MSTFRGKISTLIGLSLLNIIWPAYLIYLVQYSGVSIENEAAPLILFYTPMFSEEDGRHLPESFDSSLLNCSSQCRFSSRVKHLKKADIVVVNINKDFRNLLLAVKLKLRRPDQIWVMLTWEAPVIWINWTGNPHKLYTEDLRKLNFLFNWTMTYREDSDVVIPYGTFKKRRSPKFSRQGDRFSGKTRTAVFMAGNCQTSSHRERIVSELIEAGTDVDVIGKCSEKFQIPSNKVSQRLSRRCPRDRYSSTSSECERFIASTYKFYFSFENALCQDYVTEKFFRPATLNVIPVVFNGVNMTKIAAQRSYIDSRNFKTTRDLAEYLKRVGSNRTLYNSYFDWKPFYDVEHTFDKLTYRKNLCDLCRKACDHLKKPKQKEYPDLSNWFVDQSHCEIRA